MKAVILAGGLGTRLRPVTGLHPKPMADLLGRPVMEHIVERLREKICAASGDQDRTGIRLSCRVRLQRRTGDGTPDLVHVLYAGRGLPRGKRVLSHARPHRTGCDGVRRSAGPHLRQAPRRFGFPQTRSDAGGAGAFRISTAGQIEQRRSFVWMHRQKTPRNPGGFIGAANSGGTRGAAGNEHFTSFVRSVSMPNMNRNAMKG